jgi:hypothetical protein
MSLSAPTRTARFRHAGSAPVHGEDRQHRSVPSQLTALVHFEFLLLFWLAVGANASTLPSPRPPSLPVVAPPVNQRGSAKASEHRGARSSQRVGRRALRAGRRVGEGDALQQPLPERHVLAGGPTVGLPCAEPPRARPEEQRASDVRLRKRSEPPLHQACVVSEGSLPRRAGSRAGTRPPHEPVVSVLRI